MSDGNLTRAAGEADYAWRKEGGDKGKLVGAIQIAALRHPDLKCSAALPCVIADELILKGWVKPLNRSIAEWPITKGPVQQDSPRGESWMCPKGMCNVSSKRDDCK